jgi:hypothetical protein
MKKFTFKQIKFPSIYYVSKEYGDTKVIYRDENILKLEDVPEIVLKVNKVSFFSITGIKLLYKYFIKKEKMLIINNTKK